MELYMSFVVTGATGQFGRLVVVELLAAGVAPEGIIATGRDRSTLEALGSGLGVRTRFADLSDRSTLDAAFAGASRLLLVSTTDVDKRFGNHRNAIDAARTAGVDLIAYTSQVNAGTSQMLLAEAHSLTEEYLRASRAPFVILRNGWYLDNYTSQLATILERGSVVGAAHDGLVSAASRHDLATAAATVLTQDGHAGASYELGGEAFTLKQLAATISELSGRPVSYQDLPVADFAGALVSAGLPAAFAHVLSNADAGIARGDLQTDSDDLQRLIGRKPTTASELLRLTLEAQGTSR